MGLQVLPKVANFPKAWEKRFVGSDLVVPLLPFLLALNTTTLDKQDKGRERAGGEIDFVTSCSCCRGCVETRVPVARSA